MYGAADIAKMVVSRSPNLVRIQNAFKETPLDISLRAKDEQVCALLLSRTPPSMFPDDLLHRLIDSNMHQLLEQLFIAVSKADAQQHRVSRGGDKVVYVLNYPLTLEAIVAIRPRILRYNESINEEDPGGSFLHLCIVKGRNEFLRLFLSRPDIDLSVQDREGNTPLLLSLTKDCYAPEIVQLLMNWLVQRKQLADGKEGATTATTSRPCKMLQKRKSEKEGATPILWGVWKSTVINKQNRHGETALIRAILCSSWKGDKMVLNWVQQLIFLGADVTAFDRKGNTALFYAVLQRNVNVIQVLRYAGASSDVVNNNGVSPVDEALSQGDEDLINVLTADINTMNIK